MKNDIKTNGYELSRNWFDWCFENPDLIRPIHTALYFFAIEHCNRLGWKDKFGLPTQMCMDAIGVSNWRTFSKAFTDIVEWGFFQLISKSKNQYSATVIAIAKDTKANTKALTKATQKHSQKHCNSIAVIDKPNNYKTKEQESKEKTDSAPGSNSKIDYQKLGETFNATLSELPKITLPMSDKRKAMVNARIKDHGKDKIMEMFAIVRQSPHLTGENDRGWRASFDWLFNPTNFLKVIEGNYLPKKPKQQRVKDDVMVAIREKEHKELFERWNINQKNKITYEEYLQRKEKKNEG
jgi:hypothetical protein